MAILTALPIRVARLYSTQHGTVVREAPNQTFRDGALVQPTANSAGYAAATAGAGAAAGNLVIAAANGQNSPNPPNSLPVQIVDGVTVLEISTSGFATSAALLSELAGPYDVAIDANGAYTLNLASTANGVFRIIDSRPLTGVIGDTGNRVKATIIPSKRLT